MEVMPPELRPVSHQDYLANLELRHEVDMERIGERHERLRLLFQTQLTYNDDD